MDYGKIVFKIDNILEKKNISKNRLEHSAKIQRTQLNAYSNNKVKRIDLDVLARICYALDAEISDIIEYIPPYETEVMKCQKQS